MAPIRIGCSGWNYRPWRGDFYPKTLAVKRWFSFYADHFSTVEINNTFYRLPAPETFAKWRDQAPAGFCYAVKANRFITQARKLLECDEPVDRMLTAARELGDHLGPILFQLPPSLQINLDRLESFLRILPRDLTSVFEFRHPSWYRPETYRLLDDHGAAFCVHDMRGSQTERVATGRIAYVRFHWGTGKYVGRYGEARLTEWAEWMIGQANEGKAVFAYFNNDIGGAAFRDAMDLQRMVGGSSPHAAG